MLKSTGGETGGTSPCLHTGDFSFPLLLLKATFLQVGQGAGIPTSKHWEASNASDSRRQLLWRHRAADGMTQRVTWYLAVHRQSLEGHEQLVIRKKQSRGWLQSVYYWLFVQLETCSVSAQASFCQNQRTWSWYLIYNMFLYFIIINLFQNIL